MTDLWGVSKAATEANSAAAEAKVAAAEAKAKVAAVGSAGIFECQSTMRHSRYVTAVSYCFLFSNVWCMLTIEHFTGMSRVFVSVQTASTLPVAAGTRPSKSGRLRRASASRR